MKPNHQEELEATLRANIEEARKECERTWAEFRKLIESSRGAHRPDLAEKADRAEKACRAASERYQDALERFADLVMRSRPTVGDEPSVPEPPESRAWRNRQS